MKAKSISSVSLAEISKAVDENINDGFRPK
jgi:hypothetical protein